MEQFLHYTCRVSAQVSSVPVGHALQTLPKIAYPQVEVLKPWYSWHPSTGTRPPWLPQIKVGNLRKVILVEQVVQVFDLSIWLLLHRCFVQVAEQLKVVVEGDA
jgi:hypothetical protein